MYEVVPDVTTIGFLRKATAGGLSSRSRGRSSVVVEWGAAPCFVRVKEGSATDKRAGLRRRAIFRGTGPSAHEQHLRELWGGRHVPGVMRGSVPKGERGASTTLLGEAPCYHLGDLRAPFVVGDAALEVGNFDVRSAVLEATDDGAGMAAASSQRGGVERPVRRGIV